MKIYQVDAFTSEPFKGNPAAVCLLDEPGSAEWMQFVAAEMNLSETAFIHQRKDGFDLRWFTPKVEVDLCGHATLASAHVLFETGMIAVNEEARFHTKSGLLTAACHQGEIELNFPATPDQPAEFPVGMLDTLGVAPLYVGKSRFDYLVEIEKEQELRNLKPDFNHLRELGVRGVMVTCHSTTSDYDFVSRFFAPGAGIDEDPVTGSAHCCLGPYWSKKLGKTEFIAYQASARGGVVRVRLDGERIRLSGQAVTVFTGELLV
jgi:PhzF family phenazine biosynthesis protein